MRVARLVALFGISLWAAACAHAPPLQGSSYAGTWELQSLRAALGGSLVELSPQGREAVGADGRRHVYSASGLLALAPDGTCRLLLDVRVDGAPPGRSERACTWRGEGERLTLVDEGSAVTVYKAGREGRTLVLEALAQAGEDDEHPTGERMRLAAPSQSRPLAVGPDTEGGEGL
jgi:hypothetical protein